MIVPAKRKFIKDTSILVKGRIFHVDSGMGGSFRVEYTGKVNGKHQFRNLSQEFSSLMPYFDYSENEVCSKVYTLVPENPNFK